MRRRLTWHRMFFWLSRWCTNWVALSSVVFEISVGGAVAGTPESSSFIVWLKTWSAVARRGTSSGIFNLGGTFPCWMAVLTSTTNWSIVSRYVNLAFSERLKWMWTWLHYIKSIMWKYVRDVKFEEIIKLLKNVNRLASKTINLWKR